MKEALEELKKIVVFMAIFEVCLFLVFFFTENIDYTFFMGAVFGCVFAIAQFLLFGTLLEKALKKPPEKARNFIMINYLMRYILTGAFIALVIIAPYTNTWPAILPLFAVKFALFFSGIAGSKNKE